MKTALSAVLAAGYFASGLEPPTRIFADYAAFNG